MGQLQKFSSSFIGYYSRTFIYFHSIVFGLFGLGYLLYLIDFQIARPDIRSFFMSIFILSLVVVGMNYVMHRNSTWTFKKIIRSFANASISIILVLGLLISWDFFNEEYKNGYFALAFSIATVQGIVLYILVSISDIILRNQYEINKLKSFIKQISRR